MITYTWKVSQLDRNTSDGGVITAHWECKGDDGEGTNARVYSTASFDPDPSTPGFKPYDQLTEADVLGWIWASEDGMQARIEGVVAKKIDAIKTPPVSSGTPW